MNCTVDKVAPLQASTLNVNGTTTYLDSDSLLLDPSAPSSNNDDMKDHQESKGAPMLTPNSVEFLEDIKPPSILFDLLDFSDDVIVDISNQDGDVSSCSDDDSGSDWSFLDDDWWKIKPAPSVEDPLPSSTTTTVAPQSDDLEQNQSTVINTDSTQVMHSVCESDNNQTDEGIKQEAVCSDSTVCIDSDCVTLSAPIASGHLLESCAESTQFHQNDVITSSELTYMVANDFKEAVPTIENEREPDSTVTLLPREESVIVPRAPSVERGDEGSECTKESSGGTTTEMGGVATTGDSSNRFKSRLPSPKVKSYNTDSPVKCSQLEELRELRNITFVQPPYITTDTHFPLTTIDDHLPSTTFNKPSESNENQPPLTCNNTTIVLPPTVQRPAQEQLNDSLTGANVAICLENKDVCNAVDNNGGVVGTWSNGCDDGEKNQDEEFNTSGSSVQSQASSVSSTGSREYKESNGGGGGGNVGVDLKSKLPRKSGIPRSTSDNNLSKASKPLNKTFVSKLPSRRQVSKLKRPTASIKHRASGGSSKHHPSKTVGNIPTAASSVTSKPPLPTTTMAPTSTAPSLDAIPSENTVSSNDNFTSCNDNTSTIFDATVVSIRSQPSGIVESLSVQSTPVNASWSHVRVGGGGGAIVGTPSRSGDVQHVRPTYSLSSIDSEDSSQKPKPSNKDETYTIRDAVSTPTVDNKMIQTPSKRNRRSLIPTPSGKEVYRQVPPQSGPIPYNCDTPDSSPIKTATNQQENASVLMPPPKTKGLVSHGKLIRPTGLKKPKQIRPKGNLGDVSVVNRGVFKPRNGRIGKPRSDGPLKSQVYVTHKLEKFDDMAAMTSRPKIVHSPLDKENRPATPHSKWSPVRKKKPMSFEDACIQCTKRV